MKIAIYGGAFNPVHSEHVNIVKKARESLSLDKVIVIPTFISPHKRDAICARPRERLKAVRLAFSDLDFVEVSDEELKRGGISYSYVTCRAVKKRYPDALIYFLMGADMLKTFHLWKNPEEILKCVTPAVAAREGEEDVERIIRAFSARFSGEVAKVDYKGGKVSSARVRTLAALGCDLSRYEPPAVRDFIAETGLYARPDLQKVRTYLTESRWEHTVRVAVTACENCRKFNIPEDEALTAAALHDCAKYLGAASPELAGFTPPDGVPEPVIHQFSGAYVAEHTFGVTDVNILNAVRYHTSGRAGMSGLEKLIFLSDMLEEGRDFEGVDELRRAFSDGLDKGMTAALSHQINYLKSSDKKIYPLTQKAYDFMTSVNR